MGRLLTDTLFPAGPTLFTLFAVGLYWGENVVPLLAPNIAFWGVVILFYLSSRIKLVRKRRVFDNLLFLAGALWLASSIGGYLLESIIIDSYGSLLFKRQFLLAYLPAIINFGVAAVCFVKFEPYIMRKSPH